MLESTKDEATIVKPDPSGARQDRHGSPDASAGLRVLYPPDEDTGLQCFFKRTSYQDFSWLTGCEALYIERAKVFYLLYHEISNIHMHQILAGPSAPLKYLSTEYRAMAQKIRAKAEEWTQCAMNILRDELVYFRLHMIYKLVTNSGELIDKEWRRRAWMEYDKGPRRICRAVFEEPLSWLAQDIVFERRLQAKLSESDKRKAKAMRTMFRTRFLCIGEVA